MIALVAVLATLAIVSAPIFRALDDRLWAASLRRLLIARNVDDEPLLRRLEAWRRMGRPHAQALAASELARLPYPSSERRICVLAILAPDTAIDQIDHEDSAYGCLVDLRMCRVDSPALCTASRCIAAKYPGAFSRLVLEDPHALALWMPLPKACDAALEQLMCTEDTRERRLLLSLWERQSPGQVADLLFRLPPEKVMPSDRRHLLTHYPDAGYRLGRLAREDPLRAQAFGYRGD